MVLLLLLPSTEGERPCVVQTNGGRRLRSRPTRTNAVTFRVLIVILLVVVVIVVIFIDKQLGFELGAASAARWESCAAASVPPVRGRAGKPATGSGSATATAAEGRGRGRT